MARRPDSSKNPRQMPSRRCGCRRCLEKYPGDRKRMAECIGSWQARYTAPDGSTESGTYPTWDEANDFLNRMRAQVADRTWIDPKRSSITLGQWYDLAAGTVLGGEEATRDRDERMWRNHVAPAFVNWRLADIAWLDVQSWVNGLEAPHGPLAASSIAKPFQILDRLMAAAVRDRRLPFNPCEGIKLPKQKQKHKEDRKPPTYAELWRIRACLPDYHHTLLIVAQETGLRWGELAGLRACWVDLKGRRLQVREVLTEVKGKLGRKAYPKSDAGLRTVPLTGLAVYVLRSYMAEHRPSTARTSPEDGLHQEELVFRGRNGAPLRRSSFRRLWIAAITEAGVARVTSKTVTVERKNPETGRMRKVKEKREEYWPEFRDTRAACASRLHDRGAPEAIIQEFLGHERAGSVTWLYTHAASDVAGQVEAALRDGRPGQRRRLRAVA